MWNRARLDPFVDAVLNRLAFDNGVEVDLPRRGAERAPREPVARREWARRADETLTKMLGVDPPRVATMEQVIPVSDHPDARVRVYWPTSERPSPDQPGRLPIQVYFFGGSFTMGGIDWVGLDAMFRARAAEAGIILVAGEYSLAPEVQFPAQPEQCWSIFEWAATHAPQFGGDPSRMAIGGASAGGNLAAAVTLMNRDRGRRPIRLQVLEVPVVDLRGRHMEARALSRFLPGFMLRRMIAKPLTRDYLGVRNLSRTVRHPYASPLLAADLSGLPPALILTAEIDPLRGDGEAYARALSAAGVPATCVRYIGQNHGSGGMRHLNPAADHANRQVIATLRTLHEPEIVYSSTAASTTPVLR